ncbi:hypothetical protein KAI92_04275 [Candidatus Parcubacteria bacterium]|nr:hypothetical protein [Candidatus Parcubacteria bacterium]
MKNLYKILNDKINHLVWSLITTGIVLIMLAVLVFSTEFMIRLMFGILILIIAYMFIYGAYKVHAIKKEVKKYLKF